MIISIPCIIEYIVLIKLPNVTICVIAHLTCDFLCNIADHETELKIAKSQVRELELTLYTQREEVFVAIFTYSICAKTAE